MSESIENPEFINLMEQLDNQLDKREKNGKGKANVIKKIKMKL
jgi:hypothetical protein